MINNIKTIVYHRTLCVSVLFIVLINISVENFKRKIPPTFYNNPSFIMFSFGMCGILFDKTKTSSSSLNLFSSNPI